MSYIRIDYGHYGLGDPGKEDIGWVIEVLDDSKGPDYHDELIHNEFVSAGIDNPMEFVQGAINVAISHIMHEFKETISDVKITDPDGKVLDENEAQDFIRKLQRGVFYLPQNR